MAIRKGQAWTCTISFTDAVTGAATNLSGVPLRMQIRPLPESATVYADLTSSNGKINTTSAATGLITLSLSSTDTDAIPIGSHHFDLIRTDTTLPMVIGRANVQQGVTR